jgi:hypothetical protein
MNKIFAYSLLATGLVLSSPLLTSIPSAAQSIDIGPGGPRIDLRDRRERERDEVREDRRRDRGIERHREYREERRRDRRDDDDD